MTPRRSEFGRGWSRFLDDLTVSRIKESEAWLREAFRVDGFDGKTFLDLGCGGGLFSLAARRLGARVHAFDNDRGAVACASELRLRQCGEDPNWKVELGSILDRDYVASLGSFDMVHAWGVLHHTGDFWAALENTKLLVAMGGRLVVSAAEEAEGVSEKLTRIKQTYARKRGLFATVYALRIIAIQEWRQFSGAKNELTLAEWLRRWRRYDENSPRNVTRWQDWIRWISSYPYQCAYADEVVDFCAQDGLPLISLRLGNSEPLSNEFLFLREAAAGQWVTSPTLAERSVVHRYGSRVTGPYRRDELGVTGVVSKVPARTPAAKLWLARNGIFLKRVELLPGNRVRIPGGDDPAEVARWSLRIVAMEERPLSPPFRPVRGQMWEAPLTDLTDDADFEKEASERSELLLLEDGRPLLPPHAPHDEITHLGGGRYSHWGPALCFSTSDGTDPNRNGRAYKALIPARLLPETRSCASRFGGQFVRGPFVYSRAGWKGSVDRVDLQREVMLHLFRDGALIGEARIDGEGCVRVAEPDEAWGVVHSSEFQLCRGQICELRPPFIHERGHMWSRRVPELAPTDGDNGQGLSPLFLFENGVQLPYPAAPLDEIAERGHGRSAYSVERVWFSTLDGSDPNQNGRQYRVFVAGTATPKASGLSPENWDPGLRPTANGNTGSADKAPVTQVDGRPAEWCDVSIDINARVDRAENPLQSRKNMDAQTTDHHGDSETMEIATEQRPPAAAAPMTANSCDDPESAGEDAALLRKSGLFDPEWYQSRYTEGLAEADPVLHYLTDKAALTHDPNPAFDSSFYLLLHPDAAASGSRPVLHYLHSAAGTEDSALTALTGADSDQQASLLRETGAVDAAWYLSAYPDVAATGVDPVLHYVNEGACEGRNPNPIFDTRTYLLLYPEVAAAGINPLTHFIMADREAKTDRGAGGPGPSAGGPPGGDAIPDDVVAATRTGLVGQLGGSAGRINRLHPSRIEEDADFLWRVPLPADFGRGDSEDAPNASTLCLFEDARALGPPHAPHDEIRRRGKGAYSHWNGELWFSTSDGSDPRTNSRIYRIIRE